MKKHGQSIIEYVLIAVLVILGVVLMGGYVLRSTNAHFKFWDDGVQDSFQEKLIQANQNTVPFIPTNCTCTDSALGCGLATPTSQCAGDERTYGHTCLPNPGCDGEPASKCVYDQSCCLVYYQQSCGLNILPASGYYTTTSGRGLPGTCKEYYVPNVTCTAASPCTTSNTTCYIPTGQTTGKCYYNSCYYNERLWATQCSTLPVACCSDTTSCAPTCTGVNPAVNSACYCYLSTQDAQGHITYCNTTTLPPLNQSFDISYAASLSSCNTVQNPCQMVCNEAAGYIPNIQNNIVQSCLSTFRVAAILSSWQVDGCTNDAGACRNDPNNHPRWNCQWGYWVPTPLGPIWTFPYAFTVNDCSFSICTTDPSVTIETATAVPTLSSDYSCQCCNDAGGFVPPPPPGWPANTCSGNTPNGQYCHGATPTTQCQVNFTVSN